MPQKQRRLRTLRPIRPSAALQKEYQRRLTALIDEMQRSVVWWIRAAYRKREGEIVQDAGPARSLAQELDSVMRKWQADFDSAAERLAEWYVAAAARHVRRSTEAAFKAAGLDKFMTVKFRPMTRKEKDIIQSLIIENVSLIKSIPRQYLWEVQGIVQRSVQNGRELDAMVKDLYERYDITLRRAKMITHDQNNKATESISRWRMQTLGITEGVWQHFSIGKTYRDAHVQMHGEVYNLAEGCYDEHEGRNVQPGELVNCHCSFRAVIPNFGGEEDAER